MNKEKKFVCNKNDEFELEITDLGSTGEGIGKIDGYTLFVKDALIGDKVRVKVINANKDQKIIDFELVKEDKDGNKK